MSGRSRIDVLAVPVECPSGNIAIASYSVLKGGGSWGVGAQGTLGKLMSLRE